MLTLNKISFFNLLVTIFLLSACATPYRGVVEPPNDTWLGEHGTKDLLDTLVVNDGLKRAGEIVVELEFSYLRTGVIKQTVQAKTAYGNNLILKEGYRAYAMDFSVARYRLNSGGGTDLQANADPIEWCVILDQGATGKSEKAELYCLLWVSSNEAHYMKSYNDYVYTPHFFGEANGMYGPMPSIREQPIELDVKLKKVFKIRSINNEGIEFVWSETDGTYMKPTPRYKAIKYEWDDNDEVLVENKYTKINVKKINEREVEVTIL